MTDEREHLWEALLANRERALRVALARGAAPADAEDCVQEALARVAAMDGVDLDRVGPLVTAVVSNLAADGYRGRTRSARLHLRLAGQRPIQAAPDERACDDAEARWLWEQRTALPAGDRQVLELRALGMTVGEVAAELGVTYKAAESALSRARTRMKSVWSGTAALLGGLLSWRPRRQAGPALAALPVVALALALLPLQGPAPAAPAPTGPARPPGESAPEPRPALGAAPGPAPAPAAPPGPAPARPAAARVSPAGPPGPSPSVLATTSPVTIGPLGLTGGSVDRQQVEQGALGSVLACVRSGPVVDVALAGSTLGCPE